MISHRIADQPRQPEAFRFFAQQRPHLFEKVMMPVFHRHDGVAGLRDCFQIGPFESIMADHLTCRIQGNDGDQLFGLVQLNDLVRGIEVTRIISIAVHAFDQPSHAGRIVGAKTPDGIVARG